MIIDTIKATATTENAAVAAKGDGVSYKSGNVLMIAVACNGEGYTKMTFELPATANYESSRTTVLVMANEGYSVNVDTVENGTVAVNKAKAPDGSEVAMPKEYTEQTWLVPASEETDKVDIIVNNSNGCHIYYIECEQVPQEDVPVAIQEVAAEKVAAEGIFTISGQQVTNPQRGLYIINGKKVVIK